MLTRYNIDPATLASARAVGLSPSALARRCVSAAIRRAGRRVMHFLGLGVYTIPEGATADNAARICSRPAYTPRMEGRA